MIKKIKTSSVRLGMYIHGFGEGSDALNFEKPPFVLQMSFTRLRLQVSNIQYILIDTDKSFDSDLSAFLP